MATRRDILDVGSLAVPAGGQISGPWTSTDDASELAVVAHASAANVAAVYVQESPDQVGILFENWVDINHGGDQYKFVVKPGTEYVRFNARSTGAAITVDYSMRSLST